MIVMAMIKEDSPVSNPCVRANDGVQNQGVIPNAGVAQDDRLLDSAACSNCHIFGYTDIGAELK